MRSGYTSAARSRWSAMVSGTFMVLPLWSRESVPHDPGSVDGDDLDPQLGAGGGREGHGVASARAEQRLAQRGGRADDVEVVVALLDRPDQVALDLVVALVPDADDRAVRHGAAAGPG